MPKKYNCELCDFHTDRKNDYSRHLKSNKHIIKTNFNPHITSSTISTKTTTNNNVCSYCNVCYSKKYNLTRHLKICPMKIDYKKLYEEQKEIVKKKQEIIKKQQEKIDKLEKLLHREYKSLKRFTDSI